MALVLLVNGRERDFDGLEEGAALDEVVSALGLKADRVAVELRGEIVPRAGWAEARVTAGDKLEVVHFVGGGA